MNLGILDLKNPCHFPSQAVSSHRVPTSLSPLSPPFPSAIPQPQSSLHFHHPALGSLLCCLGSCLPILSRQVAYQNLFLKTVLVLSLRGILVPAGEMIEISPQIHVILTRTLDGLIVISPLALRTITEHTLLFPSKKAGPTSCRGGPKLAKHLESACLCIHLRSLCVLVGVYPYG